MMINFNLLDLIDSRYKGLLHQFSSPEDIHNVYRTNKKTYYFYAEPLKEKLKLAWERVWKETPSIPPELDQVPPFFVERELIHRLNSQWDRYSSKKDEIYTLFNLSPTLSKTELIAFFSTPVNLSSLWMLLAESSSIAENNEWFSILMKIFDYQLFSSENKPFEFLYKFMKLIKQGKYDYHPSILSVRKIFDNIKSLQVKKEADRKEGDEKALVEVEGDLKEEDEKANIEKLKKYFGNYNVREFHDIENFCHLLKAIEVVYRPWIIVLADVLKDPDYQLLPHEEIMKIIRDKTSPLDLEHALASIPEPSVYSFALGRKFGFGFNFNKDTYHLLNADVQTQDKAKMFSKLLKTTNVKKIVSKDNFECLAEAQAYFEIFKKSGKTLDFTRCLISGIPDRTHYNAKIKKNFNLVLTICAVVIPILAGIGTFLSATGPLWGVLLISAIVAILFAYPSFILRYEILEYVKFKDWSKNLTKHMVFSLPNQSS